MNITFFAGKDDQGLSYARMQDLHACPMILNEVFQRVLPCGLLCSNWSIFSRLQFFQWGHDSKEELKED